MSDTMKTLRLKVKKEAYPWLSAAAIEVNQIWNWAAEYTQSRIRNGLSAPTGFDLTYIVKGWAGGFDRINCDTIHQVVQEYARKRRIAKKVKLRWRSSFGSRRSLGWIPVRGSAIKRKGNAFRFCGKTFRVFENERLHDWKGGAFAQDAVGDWFLCMPVEVAPTADIAPQEAVGVDLGLKTAATTSDGDRLESRHYRAYEARIAQAQRRGHKHQAKRMSRKVARCRNDGMHKFSRMLVDRYQQIYIGDVSSATLVRTRMAKSVHDAGWYAFKQMVVYKGENAGRSVEIVSEWNTSRACSNCGSLSGPKGLDMLGVRAWTCEDCGTSHDRDINAAKNILARAKVLASVSGNEAQP
jgi:putative transposase